MVTDSSSHYQMHDAVIEVEKAGSSERIRGDQLRHPSPSSRLPPALKKNKQQTHYSSSKQRLRQPPPELQYESDAQTHSSSSFQSTQASEVYNITTPKPTCRV